ncbi:hypothetical protein AML62_00935 [Escherichia coli]|nr:hypothetical protein AML62_00935 [Escherichia coli]
MEDKWTKNSIRLAGIFITKQPAQITFLNASGTLWLLKRGIQGLFMALTQYIFILPENTDGLLLSVVQCRLRTFALLSQQS